MNYRKPQDKKIYVNLKLSNHDTIVAKLAENQTDIDCFMIYKPRNQDWIPLTKLSRANIVGQGLLLLVKEPGRTFTEKQFHRKFAKYYL